MGGRGSGRPTTYCGKATTEDSLPLDIRRLRRNGLLTPGHAFSWQWTVNDRVRASIQIRVETWQVELAYSHTPTGGSRSHPPGCHVGDDALHAGWQPAMVPLPDVFQPRGSALRQGPPVCLSALQGSHLRQPGRVRR